MEPITENEFVLKAQQEHCHANLNERTEAVSPSYVKYKCFAQELLGKKTYPTWRINRDGTEYIGAYEISRNKAFPISYNDLSKKPQLFSKINFKKDENYLKSVCVISFYCEGCGVYVIKDGNHRLLQCVLYGLDPELEVYQVVSRDWSSCKVDMKNFCECNSS